MTSRPDSSTSTAAVLSSTRLLLELVRGQAGHAYADEDFSPISDLDLEVIARRFSCRLTVQDLPAGVQEIAIPGYLGDPTIVVNRSLPAMERRLAVRHGLAHLVAGELEGEHDSGIRFMSSIEDPMTMEERRADLFALADLVPDRELVAAVHAHPKPGGALAWMSSRILTLAPSWPVERVEDRARLRWELHFLE